MPSIKGWIIERGENYWSLVFLMGCLLSRLGRQRVAGLDMTSRAPYDAVIDRMDAVMDQIEMILENREG